MYRHNQILRDENNNVSDKSIMDKIGVEIAIETSQNEAQREKKILIKRISVNCGIITSGPVYM